MNVLKQAECEIRNMVQAMRNGKVSLYEIAIRCRTLLNNLHDYAESVGVNQRDVLPRLNALLIDSNVSVETLMTVLRHRPDREQWTIGINRMSQEIEGELRKQRQAESQFSVPKRKRTVKIDEFKKVETKAKQQEQVIEQQKAKIDELSVKVSQPVPKSLFAVEDNDIERNLRTELKRVTDALNAEKVKSANLSARVNQMALKSQELRSQLSTVTLENKSLSVELKSVRRQLSDARAELKRISRGHS
jgi:chromosome segregation ATPase